MTSVSKYLSQVLVLIIFTITSCHESASSQGGSKTVYESDQFRNYWYAGKAEVNSYTLSQARYGDLHDGNAVLIFVSEDLSRDKQVKLDNPDVSYKEKINVLKLNFMKKFVTGIYPYSMMLSTFTPINRNQFPNSIKASMSSQEWCGHVYTQMNLRKNSYDVMGYSYFEKEGDERFSLERNTLEDEIWNIIRIEPDALPLGEFKIIPGLFFTRLSHRDLKVESAVANKEESENDLTYTINVGNGERILSIRYEKSFPHKILGWTEEYKDLDGKVRTTEAKLSKTLVTQYWKENKNQFRILRDSLNLPPDHE